MPAQAHSSIALALILGWGALQCLLAQGPEMAMTARQAIAELNTLTEDHPNSKEFLSAAEGAYPVASVNDRPTVGFIGQLNDEVTATEWLDWAAGQPAVHAGTCRYGIASFRIDAYHLDALDDVPMELVELASRKLLRNLSCDIARPLKRKPKRTGFLT